jgi:outer membrane protein
MRKLRIKNFELRMKSGTSRASSFLILNSKFLILLLLVTGCASARNDVGTAKSPSTQWTPPANAVPAATPASRNDLTLPPNFTPGMPITLAQVVDIALANNSTTRLAWLQARAAQAGVGSAESAYLPEVDVDAQIANLRTTSTAAQTTFGPSLALNYLLFDFGGRAATVEGARQALIASDFLHNQAIQDVILRTQ